MKPVTLQFTTGDIYFEQVIYVQRNENEKSIDQLGESIASSLNANYIGHEE